MADSGIATAADYADAMITARRAKNVLVLLLLLFLLAQLTLFFLVRFDVLHVDASVDTTVPTTMPAHISVNWSDVLHYVLAATTFLGVTFTIVLGFVILLIANIMLVGRLIGVARVTSAYIWSLILLVLLFPWQSFLGDAGVTLNQAAFKIPGVLCTWEELSQNAHFSTSDVQVAALKWARFVAFPVLAILILLAIQIKSNRGMRQALGEEDLNLSGENLS